MAKRTKKDTKYPDKLYVYMDEDGNEEYPVAYADPNDCIDSGEKRIVALYTFQKLVKITNAINIEDVKER